MNIEIITAFASLIFILFGFVSLIYPVLPPVPMVLAGIFFFAVGHGFEPLSRNFLLLLTVITALTLALDYSLAARGIERIKAGWWGIGGAVAGGTIGLVFGPWGGYLVGPVMGAVIFEILRGHDQPYAYTTGDKTVVMFLGGTLVKMVAAVGMVGLFLLRLQGKI